MALITRFISTPHANPSWRTETTCGYLIADVDGRRVLHLETYGSAKRHVRGKGSQFLQIDADRAKRAPRTAGESVPRAQVPAAEMMIVAFRPSRARRSTEP